MRKRHNGAGIIYITYIMIMIIIYQEEAQRRRERVHFDDRTRGGSSASGIMIHTCMIMIHTYMNAYIRT